jgi:acylpyruvate hydrolase
MHGVVFRDSNSVTAVGKIICLGRNYPEHAKEMHAEAPTTPILFLKPSTALVVDDGNVVVPPFSNDVHHEVELVMMIGEGGKNIPRKTALHHVAGYAVGLDMTLRDVQSEAKKKGLPWSVAKGFDTSAPVSPFVRREQVPDPHALTLSLSVNGTVRQRASTGEMIFRCDEIVAFISTVFTLEQGDLIFTGTPQGVGRVERGDVLEGTLTDVGTVRAHVV